MAAGLLVCCAVLPAQEPAGEKAALADMKKLQGTWKVSAGEAMGKKATAQEMGIDQLVIQGDKVSAQKEGKDVMTLRFRLDPSKQPKAMDWINERQPDAPPLPGIYAVTDDGLRLCFPMLPKKGTPPDELKKMLEASRRRPTSFETAGKPIMSLTAQRQ